MHRDAHRQDSISVIYEQKTENRNFATFWKSLFKVECCEMQRLIFLWTLCFLTSVLLEGEGSPVPKGKHNAIKGKSGLVKRQYVYYPKMPAIYRNPYAYAYQRSNVIHRRRPQTGRKRNCRRVCQHRCTPDCDFSCCVPPPPAVAPQPLPRPAMPVQSCASYCPSSCFPDCSPSCCKPPAPPMLPPPPPPACPISCPTSCYPQCSQSCCQQTPALAQLYKPLAIPPPVNQGQCPQSTCSQACFPKCSPQCCASTQSPPLASQGLFPLQPPPAPLVAPASPPPIVIPLPLPVPQCPAPCSPSCLPTCTPQCCAAAQPQAQPQAQPPPIIILEPPSAPQPPTCPAPCPSSCYPQCNPTCCSPPTKVAPKQPPPPPPPPQAPQAPTCPAPCPASCFPQCNPTCCSPTTMVAPPQPPPPSQTLPSVVPPPPAQTCPGSCPSSCAPSCSADCCCKPQYNPDDVRGLYPLDSSPDCPANKD
ncbi:hypothetical protein ACROYT_G007439 [Oculina patagonica]